MKMNKTVFTVAGAYALFEWQYAVMADESAGIAVLGSQGDIWDAQKDMTADVLGSFAAMTLFAVMHRRPLKEFATSLKSEVGPADEGDGLH